jgi:hypothetical protein
MDRKMPADVKADFLCYESHIFSLEKLVNVSGVVYNSVHDQRTHIK